MKSAKPAPSRRRFALLTLKYRSFVLLHARRAFLPWWGARSGHGGVPEASFRCSWGVREWTGLRPRELPHVRALGAPALQLVLLALRQVGLVEQPVDLGRLEEGAR